MVDGYNDYDGSIDADYSNGSLTLQCFYPFSPTLEEAKCALDYLVCEAFNDGNSERFNLAVSLLENFLESTRVCEFNRCWFGASKRTKERNVNNNEFQERVDELVKFMRDVK